MSFDKPADNARFAQKIGFPFPLLSDTERRIAMAYGAADDAKAEYARRIAYVIDESGHIGQSHDKVDARAYPKQQLETL